RLLLCRRASKAHGQRAATLLSGLQGPGNEEGRGGEPRRPGPRQASADERRRTLPPPRSAVARLRWLKMLAFPESFLTGEREPCESTLLALIHPEHTPPTSDDVQDALDELGFEIDEVREPEEPPEAGWAVEFSFDPEHDGAQRALGGWMRLWLEPIEDDSYIDLEQRIDAHDFEHVRRA